MTATSAEASAGDELVGLPPVAYVIGTYPLLTTTFIDREVRLLRSWGQTVDIVSLRRPGAMAAPDQQALAATTMYARPVAAHRLVRRHLHFLWHRPSAYLRAFSTLVLGADLALRDRLRTIGHFGLGVSVAGQLREAGDHARIHAHFIDRAATVAYVAARLLDVPYSVTAHASDIYVAPLLLRTKVSEADFVATCTGYNQAHLIDEVPEAAPRVALLYHGLELERYDPSTTSPASLPTLLAVGQLRDKKGLTHLVAACRELTERGLAFRCEIIGEGPQRAELERQVHELGLEGTVVLRGALPHDAVIDSFRRAWLFVLPCVISDDGDRDGIPNVILEAMAMALPVVSTHCSGIPEVVTDGVTGRLVPPADPAALADALADVLQDPGAAARMGAQGRAVVEDRFDVAGNVRALRDRFADPGRRA
jgi:glycosyltransferase involved in cell wall biosynthesis